MKVSELIEWLKTQDKDAIAQVLVRVDEDCCEWKDFSPEYSEFYDFTDKDTGFQCLNGKRFLELGGN